MVTHANVVPWRYRILALLGYGGAAPIVYALPVRKRSPFLQKQTAQALALFLALAIVLAIVVLLFLAVSYALVFQRGLYENQPVERIVIDIQGTLLLLWLVAWLIGVVKALKGSESGIPYLTRLRDSRWGVRVGLVASIAISAFMLAAASLAVHGAALADNEVRPAKAYMLYDDLGWVPAWIFELGFYRMARAAEDAWGPHQVVVAPFTYEALETAVGNGAFVFLSSHGTEEGLYTRERWFNPEDVAPMAQSPELRYVYISACDSGLQAKAWEEVLKPAQVITFNRLSAVIEHVYWLWLRGPDVIRRIAAEDTASAQ